MNEQRENILTDFEGLDCTSCQKHRHGPKKTTPGDSHHHGQTSALRFHDSPLLSCL